MRLILGVAAFAVWAPPSLVGLPLAALLAVTAARESNDKAWVLSVVIGTASAALLALPGGGRLAAVTRAYAVLLAVAFLVDVLLFPPRAGNGAFLRHALRATTWAGVGCAALVAVVWGTAGWLSLAWEARRNAGMAMRWVVKAWPEALVLYEPIVRFVSVATPVTIGLKGFVGLALAWAWHRWLTAKAAPGADAWDAAPITTS